MMTSETTSTADREIVISRLIDAPRDLVFKAWTHPDHVVQWWGPSGFSTTTREIDVRPGGVWRYVMHGPDGTDYPNRIDFREVVEPERLAYDHSGDSPEDALRFETTVTFEDRDGKTELTMRSLFETAALRDQVIREYGALEGGKQTLERLAGHLENTAIATEDELIIARTFKAPRELVFKCWTEPEHFKRWWGPHGFDAPSCTIDLRVGGAIHFNMHSAEHGMDIWAGGVFQVVDPPSRIVLTDYFADADGNKVSPASMGMSDAFPEEALVTVDFVEHEGNTTMVMRQTIPAIAPEREGATVGWGESFDKLDAYLARQENIVIAADEELIIVRTFDAPRELVFACWTDPEHFMQWWGPTGFEIPACNIDATPGGVAHFDMRSSQHGMDMWYGRLHQEVTPPSRIVFTEFMTDADGNQVTPAEMGMGADWPAEMLVTVDFLENDGKTTMVLRPQVASRVPGREQALGGWSQALDKLDAYLAAQV